MSKEYNITLTQTTTRDYKVRAESVSDAEMLALGYATAEREPSNTVRKVSEETAPWKLEYSSEVPPVMRGPVSVVPIGTVVSGGAGGTVQPVGRGGGGAYSWSATETSSVGDDKRCAGHCGDLTMFNSVFCGPDGCYNQPG